jgi:hypothetical protein
MSTLESISLALVLVALTAIVAYAVLAGWRRVMNDERQLPFFRVLERERIPQAALDEAGDLRIALAVRRCALCGGKDDCRAAFAAGRPHEAAADCPNAELFEALKST